MCSSPRIADCRLPLQPCSARQRGVYCSSGGADHPRIWCVQWPIEYRCCAPVSNTRILYTETVTTSLPRHIVLDGPGILSSKDEARLAALGRPFCPFILSRAMLSASSTHEHGFGKCLALISFSWLLSSLRRCLILALWIPTGSQYKRDVQLTVQKPPCIIHILGFKSADASHRICLSLEHYVSTPLSRKGCT